MHTPGSEKPLGDYEYRPTRVLWLRRTFPSLCFYGRIFPIIWSASARSRRGRYSDRDFCISSRKVLRAFEKGGVSVRIEGTENFHGIDGPCVFVGNHMSTAETFLLPCLILPSRPICFVVKQSLVEYPVFKHVMIHQRPIVVGRKNPREDLRTVFTDGCAAIEEGRSVIVFPQTTRSVEFDPEQFNSIGAKLARKAGVPVVPLALKTDAWSNGKWIKDLGPFRPSRPMHFAFGESIPTDESTDREINARVMRFIQERLSGWSRE